VQRFENSRKRVSYLGLNPSEDSRGGHQRRGHISKQGNAMLRWLLVEAAPSAVRLDPQLRRLYLRLKFRRGAGVAKVAWASAGIGSCARRTRLVLRRATPSLRRSVRMSGSPAQTVVGATASPF
jgi:transposase